MKSLLVVLVLLTFAQANANTITCSNSNQSLAYTHRTATSPAIDAATLRYEEYSQHKNAPNEANLDFHLSNVQTKQVKGTKVTTAYATGSIAGEAALIPFKTWVVCSELVQN